MAAAEVLGVGSTAANSADQTITTTPKLYALKTATDLTIPAGALVYVDVKDDSSRWTNMARLSPSNPSILLSAAGVYRFRRRANGRSVGVFSA